MKRSCFGKRLAFSRSATGRENREFSRRTCLGVFADDLRSTIAILQGIMCLLIIVSPPALEAPAELEEERAQLLGGQARQLAAQRGAARARRLRRVALGGRQHAVRLVEAPAGVARLELLVGNAPLVVLREHAQLGAQRGFGAAAVEAQEAVLVGSERGNARGGGVGVGGDGGWVLVLGLVGLIQRGVVHVAPAAGASLMITVAALHEGQMLGQMQQVLRRPE